MQSAPFDYCVILAHDAEIDDICALMNYPRVDLELICSDAAKFTHVALDGKALLYKALTKRDLCSVPALLTDGAGKALNQSEVETFTGLISNFFLSVRDNFKISEFKIFIILTGQCAPVFGILYTLLASGVIKTEQFEIIWINGRHNGLGCAEHLRKIAQFNPIIREFNAYSSLGEGIAEFCNRGTFTTPVKFLSTDYEFSQKIDPNSVLAEYARKFNYALLAETPAKIRKMGRINDVLPNIADKVEKLLGKGDNLASKKCKKLCELFAVVLETLKEKQDIVGLSYFGPKLAILQNNLIQFPLHDLAAVLILNEAIGNGANLLTYREAYAYSSKNFIEIKPLRQEDSLLPVLHYLSNDPGRVLKHLENMVVF